MKENKAVSRAVDIITVIAEQPDSMTITEISRRLGLPKSTTFELLQTLNGKGYVEVDNYKLKTYKLGIRLFQAGITYLEKTDLRTAARPLLEAMMIKSGETAFLVTASNGKVVYLDKVESTSSVKTSSTLGSMNPMHCTGVGKALLAAYPDSQVCEILESMPLNTKTPYTITDFTVLQEDLKNTRTRGFAIDNRESELEVFCVAAPVYDSMSRAIAAISIAGLATRMLENTGRVNALGILVADTALAISKRLGFRGPKLFL